MRKEPLQALVSDPALAEGWLQVGVAAPRSSSEAHLGVREPQRSQESFTFDRDLMPGYHTGRQWLIAALK